MLEAEQKRATAPTTALEQLVRPSDDLVSPSKREKLSNPTNSPMSSISDYRGQVIVLNVWASWCPICVDELPILQKTHEKIKRHGGLVLGVATTDKKSDALSSLKQIGASYPSLIDDNGKYSRHLRTHGLPNTYLIDRQGRVAAVLRGAVTEPWLDANLEPLLKSRA